MSRFITPIEFPDFAARIGSALVQETEDYVSRALAQAPAAPAAGMSNGAGARLLRTCQPA